MFSLKEALRSSTPQVLWITRSTPIVKILETPWYPSVCLSVTSGSQRGSCCRIDRGRLLRDREYLLHAVCAEFQKAPGIPPLPVTPPAPRPSPPLFALRLQVDTYHRGLITSSNFAKASNRNQTVERDQCLSRSVRQLRANA